MLIDRIESEGLSHYSYLIRRGTIAAVIDPRRDIEIYLDLAERKGYHVALILETHRNEDYLSGSVELAEKTGAEIWHADEQFAYEYGKPAKDGQEWRLNDITLRAVSTPGHTPGSMSYLMSDTGKNPYMIFTGDTLFAGEVGRTDLFGDDRIQEMAGKLYDSIFNKILPLGDGVIVCPAHGAGSVCGSAISERRWTTIGIERMSNPRLKAKDREEFVRTVGISLEKPPYFKKMEKMNLSGLPKMGSLPEPEALSPKDFPGKSSNSIVLDTRFDGFGPAHVPSSICIRMEGVSAFAGWFLPEDSEILLVCEQCYLDALVAQLRRIGFDRIIGYLSGGMLAWHKDGRETGSINTAAVPDLCLMLDTGKEPWILDVRNKGELEAQGKIPGAYHIPLIKIEERSGEVPKDRPVYIFCGSGARAITAGSLLERKGWRNLTVVLGGFSAWKSVSCPLTR
jgi:hydroxyacylglutathione hydrolase